MEHRVDAKDLVTFHYVRLSLTPLDINEHLPTLKEYSQKCESVIECGVREGVSTWAFLQGLLNNQKTIKKLVSCDVNRSGNIDRIAEIAGRAGIDYSFVTGNDLTVDLPSADIVFIDTWHVYGQLKRELARFSSMAKKYIILHDTTVDEILGETIRMGFNAQQQSLDTGFPLEEINKGLWPAVTEFLESNKEWKLKERYINNNGLTILTKLNDI